MTNITRTIKCTKVFMKKKDGKETTSYIMGSPDSLVKMLKASDPEATVTAEPVEKTFTMSLDDFLAKARVK